MHLMGRWGLNFRQEFIPALDVHDLDVLSHLIAIERAKPCTPPLLRCFVEGGKFRQHLGCNNHVMDLLNFPAYMSRLAIHSRLIDSRSAHM